METLTFLFTDIEGSTAMLRRVGQDVYEQLLADHHRLIRDALFAHDGEEEEEVDHGDLMGPIAPKCPERRWSPDRCGAQSASPQMTRACCCGAFGCPS